MKKQRAGFEARPLPGSMEDERLDGLFVLFFGPNAISFVDREDEDFAVSDLAGFRGGEDRLDDDLDLVVAGDDFEFDLGKDVDRVFAAAVDFLVTLLTPKAFDFGDGNAFNPSLGQSLLNLIKFKGLDDGFNFFHMVCILVLQRAA